MVASVAFYTFMQELVVNYSELNDRTLLLLISRHHEEALSELYDRHNSLIFSIAFEFINDRDIAEEIMQEVFVQVWLKASTYQPERGDARVWLASLTRHKAIDTLRKLNLRPEGHSVKLESIAFRFSSDTVNPEEAAHLTLQSDRIRTALAELSEGQRQALALAFFRGYTHSEIAEILNQPLGTVKTRIRSAIGKLRDVLQNGETPKSENE